MYELYDVEVDTNGEVVRNRWGETRRKRLLAKGTLAEMKILREMYRNELGGIVYPHVLYRSGTELMEVSV